MTADPTATVADWRPQSFGRRSFRDVDDPLIEPLWSGVRVLAHVDRGGIVIVDASGEVRREPDVATAITEALRAEAAVLDGWVTAEAARSGEGIVPAIPPAPSGGDIARHMFLGGGSAERRRAEVRALDQPPPEPAPGEAVAFVAVDLLSLDGEPLLDVPLLERKRLLDAVLAESELVRRTIHVRPPIDRWIPTWKGLGFRGLAYKGANSRYRPGETNDGWATAVMPRR